MIDIMIDNKNVLRATPSHAFHNKIRVSPLFFIGFQITLT